MNGKIMITLQTATNTYTISAKDSTPVVYSDQRGDFASEKLIPDKAYKVDISDNAKAKSQYQQDLRESNQSYTENKTRAATDYRTERQSLEAEYQQKLRQLESKYRQEQHQAAQELTQSKFSQSTNIFA